MSTLDLTPRTLDLKLYVGDDPRLYLKFWLDAAHTGFLDLTDYTSWAATIRTAANEAVVWTVDESDKANGVILLELDGDSLRGLQSRGSRWDVRALDPFGKEVTFIRGRVVFREDVTL